MYLEKTWYEGVLQFVYFIPVRIKHKSANGYHMRTDKADFYFPIAEKYFEAFTTFDKSLIEYQGKLHNSSHSIITQQEIFIQEYNQIINIEDGINSVNNN